ncbi:hypothetical protein ACBY01_07100 [Sphingomonas sp. ac-8]|uniref:hypothetical protein n=1 Tax=Sphingomonas sp. ac-8 TaxID=3242977 RepID=UPI003A803519
MANPTPTGAPRVSPGKGSLAEAYAADRARSAYQHPGEMLRGSSYPVHPLSPIPAVLLKAFEAERAIDGHGGDPFDAIEEQMAYAALEGARHLLFECGQHRSHDTQAAALIVAIDHADSLLDGQFSTRKLEEELSRDQINAIYLMRDTMVRLLDWHMMNGGGALLPIAEWMGIVAGRPEMADNTAPSWRANLGAEVGAMFAACVARDRSGKVAA